MNKAKDLTFYGFFTKYSLLDNYGFINGLLSRLSLKILPEYLTEDSIEYEIKHLRKGNLQNFPMDEFMCLIDSDSSRLKAELDYSIVSLSCKITAFGLDKKIKDKFDRLDLPLDSFYNLNSLSNQLADIPREEINHVIKELKQLIEEFRRGKKIIGTSIQLTYKTSLVKKYLERLALLIDLRYNLKDQNSWSKLIQAYIEEYRKHRSLYSYFKYHFDLVFLQIIEHTSYKGEKYVATSRKEHKGVMTKSMKAGFFISMFACCKLLLDQMEMGTLQSALLFGVNYALCFVVVKEIGGIIATKQPAMTASTIAKKIDGDQDMKIDNTTDVIGLIKDVSRTQSMSFLGNVIVVIPCSFIILTLLNYFDILTMDSKQIAYLKTSLTPDNFKNLYYAAIAGIFLSISGLVAGWVDNTIIFSNFQKRFEAGFLANKIFGPQNIKIVSEKISRNLGAHLGNISLGLLLGMAFLIELILGIPFDIRHIAFSGSYLGVLVSSFTLTISSFFYLLLGVGLIGFVNFIISFCMTLFITFKTRGITFYEFKSISKMLVIDIFNNPLSYLVFKKGKSAI